MNRESQLKALVRNLGLGKTLLKVRHYFQLSIAEHHRLKMARRDILPEILRARPLPCSPNGLEVHMLLQSKRLLEGMWCYYSLARFVPNGCRLVVHDDGSLADEDVLALQELFTNCRVIR